MSGEHKDQRVTIMMSPAELQAVDEWRFTNRIGSRGEAIRQLIRKGFMSDMEAVRKRREHGVIEYLDKAEDK